MLLKMGHIKDIVDLFEPALEVKYISCLSYAFQYPEWSHKPSFELPNAYKMEFFEEISTFSPNRCSYIL